MGLHQQFSLKSNDTKCDKYYHALSITIVLTKCILKINCYKEITKNILCVILCGQIQNEYKLK